LNNIENDDTLLVMMGRLLYIIDNCSVC